MKVVPSHEEFGGEENEERKKSCIFIMHEKWAVSAAALAKLSCSASSFTFHHANLQSLYLFQMWHEYASGIQYL